MSKHTLVSISLLLGLAVGCSSGSNPGDADDDGKGNGVGATYAEINDVAKLIYDAVEAGEDVTPHIEGAFEAFGVPVLDPDDVGGAQARINAGLPIVTTRVVQHMADAYAEGFLITVAGFAEGLVEQDVGLVYPYNLGGELNDALVGALLYSFTIGGESEPNVPIDDKYILPSFTRALGQERARRVNPSFVEPAWGDGKLDPLQFTLLSFTILAKPAAGAKVSATFPPAVGVLTANLQTNEAGAFLKAKVIDGLKGKVEGTIISGAQDVFEVPLDKGDAAKVSICGSLILYGHKIVLVNSDPLLWHKPKAPNTTEVALTLTFEDDYYNNWANAVLGSAVTDLTGCKFPRQGPIEGKAIKWSVSDALEPHGNYDLTPSVTDDEGKATAFWRTITDSTPLACQVFENQRDAVGATEAVVTGLLPGWSTVETAVNFLNPNTGGQGNDPLTVLYYKVMTGDPCHNE